MRLKPPGAPERILSPVYVFRSGTVEPEGKSF